MSSIYYIIKDKTVRNAEYYYRLITDGGQLFSEAQLPFAPKALLRRVGRAGEASHYRPRLNHTGNAGK